MKTTQTQQEKATGKPELPQGTPVMCNGHKGAIIRRYDGNMYEIRLERGSVCTDQFEVASVEPRLVKAQERTYTDEERRAIAYQNEIAKRLNKAQHSQGELDALRNNAEKLAEALRGMTAAYKAVREKPLRIVALVDAAETALAQWEVAQ